MTAYIIATLYCLIATSYYSVVTIAAVGDMPRAADEFGFIAQGLIGGALFAYLTCWFAGRVI